MQGNGNPNHSLRIVVLAGILSLCSVAVRGQEIRGAASSDSSAAAAPEEIRALSDLIRGLQAQVQTLNSQLGGLRMEQERMSAEARELRRELDLVKEQSATTPNGGMNPYSSPPPKENGRQTTSALPAQAVQPQTP